MPPAGGPITHGSGLRKPLRRRALAPIGGDPALEGTSQLPEAAAGPGEDYTGSPSSLYILQH